MFKAFSATIISIALITSVACSGDDNTKPSSPTPDKSAAPAATATPATLDSAAILDQNKNSVVKILTTSPDGEGGGSGIVWQDATHVLTNAHVVIGAGSIKVVDPTDGAHNFPAKVVALSSCDDVALLSVDRAQNLKPAKVGDSDLVKAGDHVVTLGFPGTISAGPNNAIVTEGNISRIHATFTFGGQRDLLQHTAPINPGNSGGPLFNLHGEVIGLNAYSARGRQSENYAISMNEAKLVAKDLEGGKNLNYLGITLEPNDRDFANQNKLAYIDGLVVVAIDPGGPAAKAKPYPLQTGDLIFELNGTSVATVADFCDILRSRSSGETLTVRFGAFDTNGKPYNNFQYQVVVP
ncbi:MAG: trypsin-like peptidase domain-containing protein [Dehalococcoidia bacterium]|nr:trypsin-like peptidase domain-containing protein [Dehalococcoidia bacterium]